MSLLHQNLDKMVKERDPIVDIESTESECEEDPRIEQVTGSKRVKNMLRSLGLTMSFKGFVEGKDSSNSDRNSVKTSDDENNDIESLIHNKFEGEKRESMPLITKTQSNEKHKIKNSKRAPKPPRPRKGPSLSTSDLRLVKEISELVMKKRARIERLKSLKRMRSTRLSTSPSSSSSSSSNISFFAMIITVVSLIVIIYQGFGSRTTGLVSGQFAFKHPK